MTKIVTNLSLLLNVVIITVVATLYLSGHMLVNPGMAELSHTLVTKCWTAENNCAGYTVFGQDVYFVK